MASRSKKSTTKERIGDQEIPYSEIEVVNVVDVKFAPYQRGISADWVNKLSAMFDEDKCDPIVLSRRKNGDLYCISGQHRVKAAMKAGVHELFARVLEGLTYEAEADYFYQDQKNRRAMRPQDAWNASLEAKHANTVEINSVVHSLGGRVNKTADNEIGINCPHMLWKIHEYAGQRTLFDLLDLINDSWPDYKLGGVVSQARMLAGFMFFVVNHEKKFNKSRMIKNLAKVGPLKIREIGQRYRELGRTIDEGIYLALLDTYNKGLREESKIEPQKCDWRTVKADHKRRTMKARDLKRTTY